jgi:hypothetical protein
MRVQAGSNVSVGSKGDLTALKFDFRITTGSGLKLDVAACLKDATFGLMRRSIIRSPRRRERANSAAPTDLMHWRP